MQLWWAAIMEGIHVVTYARPRLWFVRVRKSENISAEAFDFMEEVPRYGETLFAITAVNVPECGRLVTGRIPLAFLTNGEASGSNGVTPPLVAELPKPVHGLLVQAYRPSSVTGHGLVA